MKLSLAVQTRKSACARVHMCECVCVDKDYNPLENWDVEYHVYVYASLTSIQFKNAATVFSAHKFSFFISHYFFT